MRKAACAACYLLFDALASHTPIGYMRQKNHSACPAGLSVGPLRDDFT